MGARTRLDDDTIRARLAELDGWAFEEGALRKRFGFTDFVGAWAFMARVALLAEKRDNHPAWSNVYNRVDVAWSTHDAGGVTALDFELAAACDASAGG